MSESYYAQPMQGMFDVNIALIYPMWHVGIVGTKWQKNKMLYLHCCTSNNQDLVFVVAIVRNYHTANIKTIESNLTEICPKIKVSYQLAPSFPTHLLHRAASTF